MVTFLKTFQAYKFPLTFWGEDVHQLYLDDTPRMTSNSCELSAASGEPITRSVINEMQETMRSPCQAQFALKKG